MPMSPRLLRPIASRLFLPTDADARAYVLAVNAADQQPLEKPVVEAIEAFITGCKSDGIWDSIKASCILAGARTLAGALVPLVGAAPSNNGPFVAADYSRATGLVGNGTTKYLDSNRANDADPQDDQSMGVWVSAFGAGSNDALIGSGAGATVGASHILAQKSPTVASERLIARSRGSDFVFQSVITSHAVGLHGVSRSDASGFAYRLSGSNGTALRASEAPGNEQINVFARGVSSLLPTTHRLAFYWVGESLDLALLDTRVSALITAIGAAV